jgi:hypothetical protein
VKKKSNTALIGRVPKAGKRPKEHSSILINGVVVGRLAGLDPSGAPRVDFPNNTHGVLPALSTVTLTKSDIGRQIVLQFQEGDSRRPIILGLLQPAQEGTPAAAKPIVAKVDGDSLTIAATREIVLQCGKASITLTADGKVAIRGTYLLSRSSGVNRLQGGSIELN